MHDRLSLMLQDNLTERIVETQARRVLLDIAARDVIDSLIGRMLGNLTAMSRILRYRNRGGWHVSSQGNPTMQHIPVVVVTVQEGLRKALALGADAYRVKPINRHWLFKTVQQFTPPEPCRTTGVAFGRDAET